MQLANAKTRVHRRQSVVGVLLGRVNEARWTLGLSAAMLLANWGLLAGDRPWPLAIVSLLEYDRPAVLHGECWRLVTGNLVHWSPEHFWLDVGAFCLLGMAYEPSFQRLGASFAVFLLGVSCSIGGALLVFLPDMNIYRGLSGVDSGIFAAALLIEAANARANRRRWLCLAPAAAVFTLKILFECWTGKLFFGTSSLGDLGQPVPLAHAAGALAAIPALLIAAASLGRDGKGGATFAPRFIDDRSRAGVQSMATDVTGDGRPDILTASKLGTFLFVNQGRPQ